MKKPPDVIYMPNKIKENPIIKWLDLSQWAFLNGDKYLYQRALEILRTFTVDVNDRDSYVNWLINHYEVK